MSKLVQDATQLKPIVERAIRALYGRTVLNTRVMKAEQFPLFKEPKEGWLVHAEFNDEAYAYSVQLDIQAEDGRITRSVELHRSPLCR